jgi:hypothetical protein
MAAAPISTTKATNLPTRRWWLSLYSRLSTKGKRSLLVICLGGTLLAQSIGLIDSSADSQSPYDNSAVQNALQRLGLAAPNDPIGDQFQVNSYTTSYQHWPAVAMDSDGDFVVVWVSDGSSGGDNSDYSIQGQRYNAAGVPQGSQFQVNSYTTNVQRDPAVSLDSGGDFVVVWGSQGSDSTDTEGYSIQGQRYNSAGVPQGSQFQVNNYTTMNQFAPAVALDSDGDFVVTWASDGSSGDTSNSSIQGQRYDSAGTPQGSQFQVNSYTTGGQTGAAVSMDSDGDFVVVWASEGSFGSDSSSRSIQGQRYDAAGTSQGSQFQINSYTTNQQTGPAVALDSDGDFVVVWQSDGSSTSDTDNYSIQGQRYNSAGAAAGSQFQANSYTTNEQRLPDVSLDGDGDFIIVWQSDGGVGTDPNGLSIQGQGYDSAGAPQGSQFQVNSYTTSYQAYPAVALDSDGDFAVVWTSSGSSGSDNSYFSIQGQRFTPGGFNQTPAPTPTITNTPTPSATPSPSATPTTTDTPAPTNTPTPTSTPIPLEPFLYLPAVVSDSSP